MSSAAPMVAIAWTPLQPREQIQAQECMHFFVCCWNVVFGFLLCVEVHIKHNLLDPLGRPQRAKNAKWYVALLMPTKSSGRQR